MRRRVMSALFLARYLLLSGCFAWGQVPPASLTPPTGKSVQVWVNDTARVVKWASVTTDTLTGTPKASQEGAPPETLIWPLAEVDSVRVKHFSATQSVLAAIGVVGVLGFIFALSWQACDNCSF